MAVSPPPRPQRPPFSSIWTQMYPPSPPFTEKHLPDLGGKVYVVTGASGGVGKEVARILYSKNAKVFIAARNEKKATAAIADIQATCPKSKGSLVFQHLDLADLATIKGSAESITSQEKRIHVLFNNAAVQALENDAPKTAQGHEIHFGVNVLGNFLFAKCLTPTLVQSAKTEPAGSVRMVWVSSLGLEMVGEMSHGITLDYLKYWPTCKPLERYGISKAGNWLYAVEFARRYKADGVVSVPCNPGHLRSDLYRNGGFLFRTIINTFIAYPSKYGAYTEVFSGLSPSLTINDTGKWVVPWGRVHPLREDLHVAAKPVTEGGNGHSKAFWDWSEDQVKEFL
ncbi:NAD(P)-binding protein [Decorospora gaudefroyi]|uniref:NAD(P)-binding protein n=1 Tax=Decorospora gaudefroyi TaxID=184978 RepID=A0A6A5JWB6_9PLEO|nr:NAD(P)-binding protein [Decorospora gaudefroyi]